MTEIFKLKKNSWHYKLMSWVWGYNYRNFPNMCPYFWLTVFNVICIIPILLVKVSSKFFLYIGDRLEIVSRQRRIECDVKKEKYIQDYVAKIKADMEQGMHDLELYKKIYNIWWDGEYKNKYYYVYANLPTDLKYFIDDKVKEAESKEQIKPSLSTSQIIAKSTISVKKGFKIIALSLIPFVLYLLYKLVLWAITWNWMVIGITLLIGIITLLVSFGLFYLGKLIWEKSCNMRSYCLPCEQNRKELAKVFKTLAIPFIWIGVGTYTFFTIAIEMFRNNCPGIEWE